MGQFIAFENNISEAPATLWEGSLRELFLPDLFLASRERSWSKMRTQFVHSTKMVRREDDKSHPNET